MRRAWLVGSLLFLASLACFSGLPACGRAASEEQELHVFAAASLQESFAAIAVAFEAENPGVRVRLHTAGTPQLLLQLREGAQVDVLATADPVSMQTALARLQSAPGQAVPVQTQVFAHNELAVVTAAANPQAIHSMADLGRADLRFAMAGPQVPGGRYARAALASAGLQPRSRSDEASVRGVLNKVLLGELDAGIVYRSDALQGGSKLASWPVPAQHQPQIDYPIAALASPDAPARARAGLAASFCRFVLSAQAQQILRAHGLIAAR